MKSIIIPINGNWDSNLKFYWKENIKCPLAQDNFDISLTVSITSINVDKYSYIKLLFYPESSSCSNYISLYPTIQPSIMKEADAACK